MTIKEIYDWCKTQDLENYTVAANYDAGDGIQAFSFPDGFVIDNFNGVVGLAIHPPFLDMAKYDVHSNKCGN